MTWTSAVSASLGLLGLALVLWRRFREGALPLEALAYSAVCALGCVGLVATGLASLDALGPFSLVLACAACAAVVHLAPRGNEWDGRNAPISAPAFGRAEGFGALALLILAAALRLPPIASPLGGYDHGTYTLRAEAMLRTGSIALEDATLAAAGALAGTRGGPADVLGLYPMGAKPVDDANEAAYRPGFYIADRERGVVVPQFFHLHPALLAWFAMIVGPKDMTWLVPAEALLLVLVVYCLARRWLRPPWSWLPATLLAVSPVAIWTHRVALSETCFSLFVWTSVLAAASRRWTIAAFLAGCATWVRLEAFIAVGAIAVVALIALPRSVSRRREIAVFLSLATASLLVHTLTSFPYVISELRRVWPSLSVTSTVLIGIELAAVVAWGIADRYVPRGGLRVGIVVLLLVLLLVGGAFVLLAGNMTAPHSRLQGLVPAIGAVTGVAALVGGLSACITAVRSPSSLAWIALAVVLAFGVFYALPSLPRFEMYFHARYVVSILVPAAFMAAALAALRAYERIRGRFGERAATWIVAPVGLALVAHQGSPLVEHPVTRLVELEGVGAVRDHLRPHVAADTIFVVGGEIGDAGQLSNRLGTALLIGEGARVIPYRNAESAHLALYEILVRGRDDYGVRRAILLVSAIEPDRSSTTVGVDTSALAPLVVRDAQFVELHADELRADGIAVPTRVRRQSLRFAMLHVGTSPEVEEDANPTTEARAGEPSCLSSTRGIDFDLPPSPGPCAVLVEAWPGTAVANHEWSLAFDGAAIHARVPSSHWREGDTLGPLVRPSCPSRLTVRGAKHAVASAECPNGGIARVWTTPDPVRWHEPATLTPVVLRPADELGHPVVGAEWRVAAALTRFSQGTSPQPTVVGDAMVLADEMTFPGVAFPPGGLGVSLTLSKAELSSPAVIELVAGETIAEIALPAGTTEAWTSEVIAWRPASRVADVRVRRVDGGDGVVHVRAIVFWRLP